MSSAPEMLQAYLHEKSAASLAEQVGLSASAVRQHARGDRKPCPTAIRAYAAVIPAMRSVLASADQVGRDCDAEQVRAAAKRELAIMRALHSASSGLEVPELAAATGLPYTTVTKTLKKLSASEMVARSQANRSAWVLLPA